MWYTCYYCILLVFLKHDAFCIILLKVCKLGWFWPNLMWNLLWNHWANWIQTTGRLEGQWTVFFQNYIDNSILPSKMATIIKKRNFNKCPKLLQLKFVILKICAEYATWIGTFLWNHRAQSFLWLPTWLMLL